MDNREVSYASIIHEADRYLLDREIKQALVQCRPFEMEYLIRRRDGSLIWVWEQGQAVTIEGREYLEGIVLDINQRKLMEEELERLATHDPLTGLFNRRQFERQLKDEMARSQRYHHPLSLLWLDVDHFKSINDRYGHLAGDMVLRELSKLLQSSVRTVDYVARYGGEELTVILPEVDESEALEMAERLRRLVEAYKITVSTHKRVSVTVSIGAATSPKHGREVTTLTKRADEAMYQAKRSGRNRVVVAAREM